MNFHLFFNLLAALLNPEKRSLMDFYESQTCGEPVEFIHFLLAHLPKRPTPTLGKKMAMARSAAQVGRKVLKEVLTLFIPDTLFRRHREVVRQKWDYSKKNGLTPAPERRKGMPTFYKAFEEVGIAPISILSKLKENRRMSWKEFCETHWDALVGCDFGLRPNKYQYHSKGAFIPDEFSGVHVGGLDTLWFGYPLRLFPHPPSHPPSPLGRYHHQS